jgi:hypothetical protein
LPDTRDELALPSGLDAIADDMARQYPTAGSEGWYEQPETWIAQASAEQEARA